MKKILFLFFSLGILFLEAQNCWPASASTDLDINNIRAKLLNGGDMWWDGVSTSAYEFPKIDTSTGEIPKNIIFSGALWMTALDETGNLKCAGQTYRTQGHEFWPGPINFGSSTISDVVCTNYDRFFPILRTELDAHISAINSATGPLSLSSISANVQQWPGKGNAYLLSEYGMDIIDDLAPFQDCNANGIYDPENGDYPLMKGDQSIFWVINDIGNTHGRSGGDPLGVEIQCMAYAYVASDAVNDATFYDYKLIKKTPGSLSDYYFSQFVDPDLGYALDDFIGCDTVLDYGFCYNADSDDVVCGADPPIVITQFLKTPDNIGMSSFSYFDSSSDNTSTHPDSTSEFRQRQLGYWTDGSTITCGGDGKNGLTSTKYTYPGNPANASAYTGGCAAWSECAAGSLFGDRVYQMSSGPYNLNAFTSLEFTVAVMVAETDPNTYSGCPDKNSLINPVVNLVDNFIDNVDDNPYSCKVLSSIVDFNDDDKLISLYPNPADDFIVLKVVDAFEISNVQVYDVLGTEVSASIKDSLLDVSNLSKGIYTVKVYSEKLNKAIVKKFVKN